MIGKVLKMLLPWPQRHERRAAVEDARGQRVTSQRAAASAAEIEGEIKAMAAQNHFAAAIAREITLRHRKGG